MLLLALVSDSPSAGASAADVPTCSSLDADLNTVHQFCHYTGDQYRTLVSTEGAGISYALKPMCVETQAPEDSCINHQRCEEPPDTFKFMVFRSSPGNPNVPWGTVCLGADDEDIVITPDRVLREFKRMSWPDAELFIQPPDGRTLVNFETNFFTTTTEPITQTITLLGQRVEIEASPVRYTWHFGDGEHRSGADPGAPYPKLTITHVYRKADPTVRPSVDVTYHGRFRINGGQWRDIPDELTVTGAPASLEVVTATPHLIG
jgi:hypothetical protein